MKPELEFFPVCDVPFTPCEPALEGLNERVLAATGAAGVVTRILSFAPNLDTSPNGTLTHDFWEEVYILEGWIEDLRLGERFTAGMYACRPPGMAHGPWRTGPDGCLTFEVRYEAD